MKIWIGKNSNFVMVILAILTLTVTIYTNPQGVRFVREDVKDVSVKIDKIIECISDYKFAAEKRFGEVESEVKELKKKVDVIEQTLSDINIEKKGE